MFDNKKGECCNKKGECECKERDCGSEGNSLGIILVLFILLILILPSFRHTAPSYAQSCCAGPYPTYY